MSTRRRKRCVARSLATPSSWASSVRSVSIFHLQTSCSLPQVLQNQPELADAAASDPARFRELLSQFNAMQSSAKLQQRHEADLLNSDPYNIEAQRKIEEAIRQEAVLENLETAMENMPESCVWTASGGSRRGRS